MPMAHGNPVANQREPQASFDQYSAIRRYQPALTFSPDGGEIAYSINTSGQFNLWRQSSDGGFPHQVTLSADQAVREIGWSPDGETLLYTADHHGDELTRVCFIPVTGGQTTQVPAEPDVRSYTGGQRSWSPDGQHIAYAANDREPTDQDVIVRNVTTGEERRVMAGGLCYPAGWSPDGRFLLVAEARSNTDGDLHLVDVEGESSRLLTEHEGEADYYPAGWVEDGSGFYLMTSEGREFSGLAFYDLANDSWEWRQVPDWDIEDAALSADGRWLVWSVNENGYSRILAQDRAANTGPVAVDLPDGVLDVMALSHTSGKLGVLWEQPCYPEEVFVVDLPTGEVKQITDGALGGIRKDELASPSSCTIRHSMTGRFRRFSTGLQG